MKEKAQSSTAAEGVISFLDKDLESTYDEEDTHEEPQSTKKRSRRK